MGKQIVSGAAGSFVLIPRGMVYTFWNEGPKPAKLLVIFSPPGFEQGFVEVWGDRGEYEEELDHATYVERLKVISEKYNQEIVGTPLGLISTRGSGINTLMKSRVLHSLGEFRLTPWHGADTLADVPDEPFIGAQFA